MRIYGVCVCTAIRRITARVISRPPQSAPHPMRESHTMQGSSEWPSHDSRPPPLLRRQWANRSIRRPAIATGM